MTVPETVGWTVGVALFAGSEKRDRRGEIVVGIFACLQALDRMAGERIAVCDRAGDVDAEDARVAVSGDAGSLVCVAISQLCTIRVA